MKSAMSTEKGSSTGNNPLEQFVLLAKSAKGAAAVELVKQVLEAPGVHVFGELLDMPNVVEVSWLYCLQFIVAAVNFCNRESDTFSWQHKKILVLSFD